MNNSFKDRIRYDVPPLKQSNLNNRETNTKKRNVRNKPSSSNYKLDFKDNKKFKNIIRAVSLGLATLTVSAGIGAGIAIKNSNQAKNEFNATDIESQIRNSAMTQISEEDLSFDGQNFTIPKEIECDRPELYKVLAGTELDQLLNEYLANPTKSNKENLAVSLHGKENDLAKLNFELVKASLADSLGVSIDDIKITYTDNRLTIDTPHGSLEHWKKNGTHNDTEISNEYEELLRPIAEAYEKSKLGKMSDLSAEELIESYEELKPKLIKDEISITNNALGKTNNKEIEDEGR